jgi:hypothetical protein
MFVRDRCLREPTRFRESDPAVEQVLIIANVNGGFVVALAAVAVLLRQGRGVSSTRSMNDAMRTRRGCAPHGLSKAAPALR